MRAEYFAVCDVRVDAIVNRISQNIMQGLQAIEGSNLIQRFGSITISLFQQHTTSRQAFLAGPNIAAGSYGPYVIQWDIIQCGCGLLY
jgi:hypothetical protein